VFLFLVFQTFHGSSRTRRVSRGPKLVIPFFTFSLPPFLFFVFENVQKKNRGTIVRRRLFALSSSYGFPVFYLGGLCHLLGISYPMVASKPFYPDGEPGAEPSKRPLFSLAFFLSLFKAFL